MARHSMFMLFRKRVDRAFELQAKQNGHDEHVEYEKEEYDPKADKEEIHLAEGMEKGDMFAMIVSAMGIFIPVASVLLLIIIFAACFLTGMY